MDSQTLEHSNLAKFGMSEQKTTPPALVGADDSVREREVDELLGGCENLSKIAREHVREQTRQRGDE